MLKKINLALFLIFSGSSLYTFWKFDSIPQDIKQAELMAKFPFIDAVNKTNAAYDKLRYCYELKKLDCSPLKAEYDKAGTDFINKYNDYLASEAHNNYVKAYDKQDRKNGLILFSSVLFLWTTAKIGLYLFD